MDRHAAHNRPMVPPKVLVIMGVSGSGKTTVGKLLAERLGWHYQEGDALHPPENVAKMSAGTPLSDADRTPWLRLIAKRIDAWRSSGEAGVVTCSALKRAYRDILVHGRGDVRIVFLDGTQDLIAGRLAARQGHFMPPDLLASQFRTLERPAAIERPITVSIDAPIGRIVDDIVTQLNLVSQ
jgi:gluconokinase